MSQKPRTLRSNQTDAEKLLWRQVRDRRFHGFKFRRQQPIESYIVDFVCNEARLIVELEGGQHADQADYDTQRTRVLESFGFRVLRFWNNEMLGNVEGVMQNIEAALRNPSPQPSPARGEGAKPPQPKREPLSAPSPTRGEGVGNATPIQPKRGKSNRTALNSPSPLAGEGWGEGSADTNNLSIRHLTRRDYTETWRAMQQFTAQRDSTTPDEIWLLEHPPVFTQGLNGKREHLLAPGDIPLVQTDRGGQVTYHGPGQLVVYVLLDLQRRGWGVRQLVEALELTVIDLLRDYDITATARRDAPGVYVDGAKIASLGLRVKRGCSYHGLSLNVAMDLEPFSRINPCGYAGLPVTQLTALGPHNNLAEVAGDLLRHLTARLGYNSQP